jgi:hypothetical protein
VAIPLRENVPNFSLLLVPLNPGFRLEIAPQLDRSEACQKGLQVIEIPNT